MFRGALISEAELRLLRRIEDTIRLGRVRRIDRDEIVLDEGSVPTSEGTVHVHCSSRGLSQRPVRAIFEPARITVQPFQWGFACYQFAALGVVEATVANDDEKNRLCPPIPYWDENADYLSAFLPTLTNKAVREGPPAFRSWAMATRLNPLSSIALHHDDPIVIEARDRIKRCATAATQNLAKLLAAPAS